jgi:hypothetical protein
MPAGESEGVANIVEPVPSVPAVMHTASVQQTTPLVLIDMSSDHAKSKAAYAKALLALRVLNQKSRSEE